ncbi:MAG: ABC transporter permease, partial [Streptosporangiaceae bacterium]
MPARPHEAREKVAAVFVAWRDLRFAKGRFALMGTVVILMTLLVGLLSGLTAGLSQGSISAITGLSADHLAFAAPATGQKLSFTQSAVSEQQWRRWAAVPGVTRAQPLGIATTTGTTAGRTAALSAFGVQPGSHLGPDPGQIAPGRAVLSTGGASALKAHPGEVVTLAGHRLTIAAVAGDASYGHTPVVWTSLADWQRLSPSAGPAAGQHATVIALSTTSQAGLASADHRLHTD